MGTPQTEIQNRDTDRIRKAEPDDDKRLMLRADLRAIVGSAVGGLVILIVLSFWLTAGRIPFIVGAAVPLFTLIAIIYQAVVYRRQWNVMQNNLDQTDRVIEEMQRQLKVMRATFDHERIQAATNAIDRTKQLHIMEKQALISDTQMQIAAEAAKITERQLETMKEQAKLMDRSLVLGTRAYVGVHSIELDRQRRRIVFEIENIGRVPAKDIKVVYELIIRIPDHLMPVTPDGTNYGWGHKEITRYGVRRDEWELRIPWLHSYGRIKLFPGSLRINIVIPLEDNLYVTPQQYNSMTSGEAEIEIIVRGVITYSDGFHRGKRTEFALSYQKGGVWIPLQETGMEHYQGEPEKPDSDYNPN